MISNIFLTLLYKDFKLEFSKLENFILHLFLSLLLIVTIMIGVNIIFIPLSVQQRLYPMLIWLIFIFSASISMGKSLDCETEEDALTNLIIFKVPVELLYLSKMLVNFVLIYIVHLVASILLAIFLGITFGFDFWQFALISFFVVFAYSALSTLLVAISTFSKIKNLLLPVLLIPLIFPVFFCALELTSNLILNNQFAISNIWFSILIGINFIYLALGINLYKFAIKD